MNKFLLTFILTVLCLHSFAGTIVHGSIYMVMGPATELYFPQIQKTLNEIEKAGYPEMKSFDLDQLTFVEAIVQGELVSYEYFLVNSSNSDTLTCILSINLKSRKFELIDVKAKYHCEPWKD